jgi:hypothetical protein
VLPFLFVAFTAEEALPDFLSGVSVLLYKLGGHVDRRALVRRLVAYGAVVNEYMQPSTTHVLSSADWCVFYSYITPL